MRLADIKHSVPIAASRNAVYPLLATGRGFTQWWAADVTESAGAVELGFFQRTTVYRLSLKTSTADTRAEWVCETGGEWADTRIVFQLEDNQAGTLLRFTHGDWKAETDYFIACNTTWGELMYRLKAAAEGRTPGSLFRVNELAY